MQYTQENDDVIEIDLQELFAMLLHWLWLILLCGIITGSLGFAISSFVITPMYESTTQIYILNKSDSNTLTYSDVQLTTQLTKDYPNLITSRTVLEQVIRTFGLQETYGSLASRVSVEILSDTRMINITVKDESPEAAQYLANEIREVASERIKAVTDIQAVNVVDEANLPGAPSEPSIPRWTMLGLLAGMFLCAGVLVVRYLLDDTIKTTDDVERYLGLSTLAVIPVMEGEEKKDKGKSKKKKSSSSKSSEKSLSGGSASDLVVEELDDKEVK